MRDSGVYKYSSILISDLAGFTEFSRKLTAKSLFNLMSKYFEIMGSIIANRRGKFVKTLGDGLLCYFPSASDSRQDRGEAVLNSVLAAIDMKIVNSYFNSEQLNRGYRQAFPERRSRIAINSGVIRIGTIMEAEDVLGSHINLTSRIEGLLGKRRSKEFDTEPIILTEMAAEQVANRIDWVPVRLAIKNIKGFGGLQLDLVEPINVKDLKITFSEAVTSREREVLIADELFGEKFSQSVYGPFDSQDVPNENIFTDYQIDPQKYRESDYVFLQLPLLATSAGRKGDSEEWRNIYFVNDGSKYVKITESSSVVFYEPKPFEYAPCVDLKHLETKGKFSVDWLQNDKLRVFMTLWNDGTDTFHVQPVHSRRWRRVYLGLVYINSSKEIDT